MLSLWKCEGCGLKNYSENKQCQACFNTATTLSPIDQIVYEQRILFDGFLRIEIFNGETAEFLLVPQDIITLCNTFYEIDIKSFETNENQFNQNKMLLTLTRQCRHNEEYFIAYKFAKLLATHNETQAVYHNVLGTILSRWNLKYEAEIAYQKAAELEPDNAQYTANYGVRLKMDKKYELALIQFKKAVELQPNNIRYISACAICYNELKDFENAQKLYLSAIDIVPDDANFRYEYGLYLQSHDKNEEALIQFEEAVRLDVDEPEYVFECAYTNGELGEFEKAHKYHLKAIVMDDCKNQHYCNHYGQFLCKYIGDFEKAKLYFMKAMEIDVMDVRPYYQLGKLMRDFIKDYVEAEKYYLKCLQIDDEHKGINASYGYLLYLMGDYEKAMKYVKIELVLDDDNKWAHLHYGLLCKRLGVDEIAERELLRAVELVTTYKKNVLYHVQQMKKADAASIDYYEKFEGLIMNGDKV